VDVRTFNLKRSSALIRWLIVICVILVFSSALLQASDLHISGSELKHCPICQLATATAQAALVVLLYFVVRATVFVGFTDGKAKTFLGDFSLFSRPPPLA
jgi:hypothetical protein